MNWAESHIEQLQTLYTNSQNKHLLTMHVRGQLNNFN